MKKHEQFMLEALKEAQKAYKKNEVPVGCVIVCNDKIIARSHNLKEKLNETLAHAELLAIKKANKKLKSWRLDECDLYVTLEPCPMCAGAIIQARIKNLYFGATDPKSGAFGGHFNINNYRFNHKLNIIKGIKEKESKQLLQNFFRELRT